MAPNVDLQVGDEVTIGMRNASPMIRTLFPDNPTVLKYTGTVLRREEWDPKDAIRITGDAFMPIRVISRSLIVSIGDELLDPVADVPVISKAARIFKVDGSKGVTHVVTVTPEGKASCTCTGYGFRRYCKHTSQVLDQLKEEST